MDGGSPPACSLSLVIPAYNEAAGIAQAVAEAEAALAGLGLTFEIIVVDDGSQDDTAQRVAAFSSSAVRLVRHETNRGYGAALRTGFEAARGQYVAFTDADCQFHLSDLGGLLELARTHDVAVGYRVDRQDAWLRKFYSRGYNLLIRTLVGTTVRDIDCALKVFRREVLTEILPESRGFFVNTEMLIRARQRGLAVAEAGVRHRPRLRGTSKVSVMDIPRTLRSLLPFWWSKVVFAGTPTAGDDPIPRRQRWGFDLAAVALLVTMACLLFLGRLGAPLLEPEEARYAEIPRQMLAEGRWLTPVLHGEDYFHKPPLLYWLVMGCYTVFGVHDWAARTVPSLAGILMVLLSYCWGAWSAGRIAGFLSAAMLVLSAKFLYQAGMLTFDSPLALAVLTSLATGHAALSGTRVRFGWLLTSALACGLGVLIKGPVALLLVVPPLIVWPWLDRRAAWCGLRAWLLYLTAAALVAGPWFVAILWSDPRALLDFIWTHNLVRYVTPLDHEEPVWFYLAPLLLGMLPWSLLLLPWARHLLKRSYRAAQRRPAAQGLFLLALLWCMAFFSLSGCKRQGYILPAFPLLALVLGSYLAHVLPWRLFGVALMWRPHPIWRTWTHRGTLVVLAIAMLLGVASSLRGIWTPTAAVVWVGVLATVCWLLSRRGPERVVWRSGALCGAAMFALLFTVVHEMLPDYHRHFALRNQVRRHRDEVAAEPLPIASYPKRWDSVSFYLQRNDTKAYTPQRRDELIDSLRQQQKTLLFVKQGAALDDLLRALPGDLEFVPHPRPGRTIVSGIVQRMTKLE